MQGGNQPKEKRSKYHEWSCMPKHKYALIKNQPPKPLPVAKRLPITMDKKKVFAIKILHTLAKLETNIELLTLALENGR